MICFIVPTGRCYSRPTHPFSSVFGLYKLPKGTSCLVRCSTQYLSPLILFLAGQFEGRATIDGATVTLKKVTQEDAGQYRCEISAPLDAISLGETNVTLKVLGKTGRKSVIIKIDAKISRRLAVFVSKVY